LGEQGKSIVREVVKAENTKTAQVVRVHDQKGKHQTNKTRKWKES